MFVLNEYVLEPSVTKIIIIIRTVYQQNNSKDISWNELVVRLGLHKYKQIEVYKLYGVFYQILFYLNKLYKDLYEIGQHFAAANTCIL